MKNLFIINEAISSSINGIGTYIKQLVACMSETEVRITILMFNSEEEAFCIEEKDGIRYFNFPGFPDRYIQRHSSVISKILRLYILDSSHNLFLMNYSPGSTLMETVKKYYPLSKQIYVIHDMVWVMSLFGNVDEYVRILSQKENKSVIEKYSYLIKAFEEEVKMCKYADKIICLSEDTYELLKKYYPIDKRKLTLIHNFIFRQETICSETDKNRFREKMFLKKDEKILLYVGRVIEQKGIMVYIEAFKEILKKYPACILVIIGAVPNWNHIMEKCYPIITKIHLTGSISRYELKNWYQIADIGILPSYAEQCSYVGLEMMAHKLPVVASDGFGIRCMFNHKNAEIATIGRRDSIIQFKKGLIDSTLKLLNDMSKNKKNNEPVEYMECDKYSPKVNKRLYLSCFHIS
ncbi:glycosyltransferase [uncultured Parabacteroides sp.]|mgnify:CR=1 FL=1|jgi:glycosyltransferase|uniref:glycosyltransferase n=1 Tax=uncultured Parabacteroides sp. TaxID=512312 RepID=UPI0025E10C6F|nr:glycosyltransferase [uncultured Parabacteroides sp.]